MGDVYGKNTLPPAPVEASEIADRSLVRLNCVRVLSVFLGSWHEGELSVDLKLSVI